MKLRLRENSIRLRLLKSEIEKLDANGFISEKITFSSSQKFLYSIKISNQSEQISATFNNGELIIEIPFEQAKTWLETDLVGLESEQKINGEKTLKILVEKDFVCLDHPQDVDNKDAYPHPKMKC